MMKSYQRSLLPAAAWCLFAVSVSSASVVRAAGVDDRPPNVILIMADDLGLAELGCTGSERIETPNIDRLRERGMLLTSAYSGSTVCAPSRCTLLTGRHTGTAQIRDNGETPNFTDDPGRDGTEEISGWTAPPMPQGWWGGQRGLEPGTETIATALKRRGYATYMAGKWGLGGPKLGSMPTDHGFDGFIGYLCQRNAHNFYPTYLVEDDEKLMLAGNDRGLVGKQYSTDLMVDRAVRFIDRHADEPFFLYYATPVPHLALQVPGDSLQQYAGQWAETPYEGGKGYLPNATPRATYAAMITRFDRNVGMMLDELERKGIADDTVVILTSDNGSTFGIGGYDPAFFDGTGGLRGHKCNLYEGGIRVPTIVTWPGRVEAGSVDDTPNANWDLMPTILSMTNTPTDAELDGIDLSPAILGRGKVAERDHLYWEYHAGGGQQAVRSGRWKAVRIGVHRDPDVPLELYDLEADPVEAEDVASEHPEVAARMLAIMRSDHTVSPVVGWNFGWNEGAPVAPEGEPEALNLLEIGPGIEVQRQFVKDVDVVIDGGTLRLDGAWNPINGSTVRFTRAGGTLVMTNHTVEVFRRKHARKMRTIEGIAKEGRDYSVEDRAEGGCVVKRIERTSMAPPSIEARLDRPGAPGFAALAARFAEGNPGSTVRFHAGTTTVPAADRHRVVFVQRGGTRGVVVPEDGGRVESDLRVGDLLALRPGDAVRFETAIDVVAFDIGEPLAATVPPIIRPDFDPALSDRPGGCATDPGAYRRLLLTWDPERGPYVNHGFNCHRVRIDDSFTHYHPVDGGWDELYLVQEAPPGAELLVCRETARLDREQLDPAGPAGSLPPLGAPELDGLFQSIPLHAGSMVLLPRGLAHRGRGGAVVQVIAVPGFRPGYEVPLDQAIQRLNGRFALTGGRRLPLHVQGVDRSRPTTPGVTR